MGNSKILVVDDDEVSLIALKDILEEQEATIFMACTGEQAIELCKIHQFALLLLDVEMPEMAGFELAKHLSKSEEIETLPILFVTSHRAGDKKITEAYESGAVDYLFKPLDPYIVRCKVAVFLELHKHKVASRAALEKAETALKFRSEFLSFMSHEIRTPLNALLGISDTLAETSLDGEQQSYVDMLHQSGEGLLELVNNILDLSKMEAGAVQIERVQFEVENLLKKTISLMSMRAREKRLHLYYTLDADVPKVLVGDPGRLRQVLLNLLSNSIKFTDQGEIYLHAMLLETSLKECSLLFSIRDTGIGIAEESQKDVFETFRQEDSSTTRKYGGTGLGLAICKQLCYLLDGTVTFESIKGTGTTFKVKLPFEYAEISLDEKEMLEFKDISVLVLCDNPTELRLIKNMLISVHAKVTAVTTVTEVETILENPSNLFHALVTDYQILIPKISQHKKQHDYRSGLLTKTIFMLHAGHQRSDLTDLKNLGIRHHIVKPINRADLLTTLRESLRKSCAQKKKSNLKRTLLIVEKKESVFKEYKELLSSLDIRIIWAGSGKEALDITKTKVIDTVLADVSNPLEGSLKLLAETVAYSLKLPFVFLSNVIPSGPFDYVLENGSVPLFKKPISHLDAFRKTIIKSLEEGFRLRVDHAFIKRLRRPANFHVLLVEDTPENQVLVQIFLKNTPVKIKIAENGKEGVDVFKNDSFDIVLMDMRMPVLDGYDATRKIRIWEKENQKKPTPILALTASGFGVDIQRAIQSGCDAHMSKPFKKPDLLRAIIKNCSARAAPSVYPTPLSEE